MSIINVSRNNAILKEGFYQQRNIVSNPAPCRKIELHIESIWYGRSIPFHLVESIPELLFICSSVSIILCVMGELGFSVWPVMVSGWRGKYVSKIIDKSVTNLLWHVMNNIIFIFYGYNGISFSALEDGLVEI